MAGYSVAVVGCTGAVGREMLAILEERDFPIADLKLLASARSAGTTLSFGGEDLRVRETQENEFEGVEIAFFSAGGSVSTAMAPEAVKRGCVVVDNSSAFRMDPEVPLVVPEVNPEDLEDHGGIIANPNCSTIIMVVVLKPLYDLARIRRVVVSTYQAVSGVGWKGMEELREQSIDYLEGREMTPGVLPYASADRHHPIAFNLIPHIDVLGEQGYTREEWKMVRETHKIMHDDEMGVTVTTVRVPVFRSHSESANIEFEREVSPDEARAVLEEAPGVEVMDAPEKMLYPMPLDCSGKDPVYVGRVRADNSCERALNLWIVGDQIRKGAALNAIQIGETLVSGGIV